MRGQGMTTRYGEDKKRYELIVRQALDHFTKRGWYVKAHPLSCDNGRPDTVGAHIPELWARKENRTIIMAVETCESIDTEDAKYRFKDLSRPEDVEFHVAVPEKCKFRAKELAENWGITVKKFWVFTKY